MTLKLDVPILEGWMQLSDAADKLEVSRTSIYRMVRSRRIQTCMRIPGRQPTFIVRIPEINAILGGLKMCVTHDKRGTHSEENKDCRYEPIINVIRRNQARQETADADADLVS